MNEQQPPTEANRIYGELYYHSSAVSAILRYLAEFLEGDQRSNLLRLSHSIPTTMRWPDDSAYSQQQADQHSVCRSVQLWLRDDVIFCPDPIRLAAIVRDGPSPKHPADGEHAARMANEL